MITPPPAEPGDKAAVLAPSSQVPRTAIQIGIERLKEHYDLNPVVYPSVKAENQLPPEDRAMEVHEAFESNATTIFAVTGGEDQMRLLRHLDIDLLRKNPTRFFGISDNTHLHLALSTAGLVSYYGAQFVPGLAYDLELPKYTHQYLERALFDQYIGEITPSDYWSDDKWSFDNSAEREWEPNDGWQWNFLDQEYVSGRIWGGCYLAIEHLLAVDRFVPTKEVLEDFILAVESSGLLPEPYFIKSVLRCLGERDLLNNASAVIVGRPKTQKSRTRSEEERKQYRNRQFSAVEKVARTYAPEIPIVYNLDFGHTDPQVPIPIGGIAHLDPTTKSISFHDSSYSIDN